MRPYKITSSLYPIAPRSESGARSLRPDKISASLCVLAPWWQGNLFNLEYLPANAYHVNIISLNML